MKGNKTNIRNVCDFITAYFNQQQIQYNHYKIHKVLYYVQAFHLVYFENNPLFDDVPEAWVNGPVYRSIYSQFADFKPYVPLVLTEPYRNDQWLQECRERLNLTTDQWEYLNSVLSHYGLMSHERLIILTHSERPWNEAREGLGPFDYSSNKISHESMLNFYQKVLKK